MLRRLEVSLLDILHMERAYRLAPVPRLAINGADTGIVQFERFSKEAILKRCDEGIAETQKRLKLLQTANKDAEDSAPRLVLRFGHWLERKLQNRLADLLRKREALLERTTTLADDEKVLETEEKKGMNRNSSHVDPKVIRDLEEKEAKWKRMREDLRRNK
ncbi:hypothetical protein BDV96DRAFT_647671 [Lophiotrema nucula]|uniref:Uncharacterized protein n=1 Tax=Lophiotrema nucula TaxID=690887 RepID=A0A6A5Z590_9PLEO|nr:hypothetical protein BDV96DRAFT_647671 [Lophiotrema nucula]